MANDLVKRFIKKDGSQRISFYREEYAENPRDNTDFPLHCEDWSRDYSIMNKQERESKSESARKLLEYLLRNYGDWKKMLGKLKDNGKKKTHDMYDCCLQYDNSRKEWLLMMWYKPYKEELGWWEQTNYDCKFDDIDIHDVLYELSDETIGEFAKDCFTDNVKVASYEFGYYGSISFSDDVSYDSDGICWIEKDEIIKYCGHTEEFWKENSFKDIDWVHEEIEAWGNNDVYGFIVEDCIKSVIHKEYTNVDKDDECYEHEDWEESDSCWGFYGELDKREIDMFDNAGLYKEEFEEVSV